MRKFRKYDYSRSYNEILEENVSQHSVTSRSRSNTDESDFNVHQSQRTNADNISLLSNEIENQHLKEDIKLLDTQTKIINSKECVSEHKNELLELSSNSSGNNGKY
jgi:hypothetical protein